jgi:hypothetical protein
MGLFKVVNKPDSVLLRVGNHLSKQHTRMFKSERKTEHAYFVLLQVGFAPTAYYYAASGALTTRFHPYRRGNP